MRRRALPTLHSLHSLPTLPTLPTLHPLHPLLNQMQPDATGSPPARAQMAAAHVVRPAGWIACYRCRPHVHSPPAGAVVVALQPF